MVPNTPQGAASAAARHCSCHLTWHLQVNELGSSASEASSTFKVPNFTPTVMRPPPVSAPLWFTHPLRLSLQMLLDLSRREPCRRPTKGLTAEPPSKEEMVEPTHDLASRISAASPCLCQCPLRYGLLP